MATPSKQTYDARYESHNAEAPMYLLKVHDIGKGVYAASFLPDRNGTLHLYVEDPLKKSGEFSKATLDGWLNGKLECEEHDERFDNTNLRWNKSYPCQAGQLVSIIVRRWNERADPAGEGFKANVRFE